MILKITKTIYLDIDIGAFICVQVFGIPLVILVMFFYSWLFNQPISLINIVSNIPFVSIGLFIGSVIASIKRLKSCKE